MPLQHADFAAENISQNYGKKSVLKGCSIFANRGDCVGIAGRNGSGKSTLLSVLAGAARPVSGRITCFGIDLLSYRKAFGEMIGYVPQTNPLIGELSVLDNLRLLTGMNFRDGDEVLRKLSVDEMLHLRVSKLSGGMQRRAAIACALIPNPPVLVMDEPTSALDLYHKSIIYGNLDEYRKNGGIIIMATHDTWEMSFCSKLYLISQGSASESTPESAAQSIKQNNIL